MDGQQERRTGYADLERAVALLAQEVRSNSSLTQTAFGEMRAGITDMRQSVGKIEERVTALEIARERERGREEARIEAHRKQEAEMKRREEHDRELRDTLNTLVEARTETTLVRVGKQLVSMTAGVIAAYAALKGIG